MDRNFQNAEAIAIGDVVTLRPACDCLALWRPLAEHLKGETFKVTGTARTIGRATTAGWDVLVLQPCPCAEIYPSCQLVPAECLQLTPLSQLCQWDDVYDVAADAIASIGARLQRRGIQLDCASHGALQLALERVLGEAEVDPLDPRLEQHLAEVA